MEREEHMTNSETSNAIELLRSLGWTGDQVSDFLLGLEGRISLKEASERIQNAGKAADANT